MGPYSQDRSLKLQLANSAGLVLMFGIVSDVLGGGGTPLRHFLRLGCGEGLHASADWKI
jgi:hypothetical protein